VNSFTKSIHIEGLNERLSMDYNQVRPHNAIGYRRWLQEKSLWQYSF